MTLNSKRSIVLVVGATFFSLHLVSHYIHPGLFGLGFHLLAFLASLLVVLFTVSHWIEWAISRNEEARRQRGQLFVMSLVILAAAIAVPTCKMSYCRGLPTGSFAMAFDRQAWAPMPRGDSSIKDRQKMLADVIKNVVEGCTYEDVRAALGSTEDASWLDESGGDNLSYYMGPARDAMIPIDGEVLVIHFDAEGRVSRWYTFID